MFLSVPASVSICLLSYACSGKVKISQGVMFSTYSCLISGTAKGDNSRFRQLVDWCGGKEFDGIMVFDECHKAKNLKPGKGEQAGSKTARHVQKIQRAMPKARVVYVSATGASELTHMSYMDRLGLWGTGTAFPDAPAFVAQIEKRGIGAMEMVALDMKGRGLFLSRTCVRPQCLCTARMLLCAAAN